MSPSTSDQDTETHLTFTDIAVDDVKAPTLIQIHLKASKTDLLGKCVCWNDSCPISAMSTYLSSKGGQDGPVPL